MWSFCVPFERINAYSCDGTLSDGELQAVEWNVDFLHLIFCFFCRAVLSLLAEVAVSCEGRGFAPTMVVRALVPQCAGGVGGDGWASFEASHFVEENKLKLVVVRGPLCGDPLFVKLYTAGDELDFED